MVADATKRPICDESVTFRYQGWGERTIQLSLFSPLLTTHRVNLPADWMMRRVQKPSHSWNAGVDHLNSLSQDPIVAASTSPSAPKIHSLTDVSCALFPLKVRSTHPLLLSESIENLFNDQISRPGMISHCVARIICISAYRNRERSGVVTRRVEKRK